MNLIALIARGRELKELATRVLPDALDTAAGVLDQMAQFARDAEAFLRTQGEAKVSASPDQAAAVADLQALSAECTAEATPTAAKGRVTAGAALDPEAKAALLQLLAFFLNRLLAKV